MAQAVAKTTLDMIEYNKIYFVRSNTKDKEKHNYVVMYEMPSGTSERISFDLTNAKIPFGYEPFGRQTVLNVEINENSTNNSYNQYAQITGLEEMFKNISSHPQYQFLKQHIESKQYYPNMRESKEGHIVRCYVMGHPKIYSLMKGKEISMDSRDLKMSYANVKIELALLWINDNNYGILWYVKEIRILSSCHK
jgi:hypothetical protein